MEESKGHNITTNDKHFLVNLPDGELLIAERIPPQVKQRLICYSCKVILEFPKGP